MIMMLRKYKQLKDYKGYGIDKVWQVDCHGKKISGTDIYLVSEGKDYVGEEYKSLKEAKNQIDIWQRS